MNELRFAARRLRQSLGFALTAFAVLAIGIGLNTAIFSVVDALVLHPLHFSQADRIVHVGEEMRGFGEVSTAYPNYLDWRHESKTIESSAVFNTADAALTYRGVAEHVPVFRTSYGFFDVVAVHPALGRSFSPDEDRIGAPGRVVLTDALWRRTFGSDPKIVGSIINLDGQAYTVIGVMGARFNVPFIKFDAIVPFGPAAEMNRGNHSGEALARLRPGVTIEKANAEFQTIARNITKAHPDSNSGWGLRVGSLQGFLTQDFRSMMIALLVAVGVVLLIACVNLIGLMLVRAAGRRQELALRTALGARPWAILRDSLWESALLAAGGSLSGVFFGAWGVSALLAFLPAETPLPPVSLDWRVLLFATSITVISALLFGLIPAWRSLGSDPNETLQEGGRANIGSIKGNRLRSALVVAEIGLALVLVLGAGLVLKSFRRLTQVDPGFSARAAITMRVSATKLQYKADPACISFWSRVLQGAEEKSAIRSVGIVSFLPMTDSDTQTGYYIAGRPKPKTTSDFDFADRFVIGGDYFDLMGLHLLRGRKFASTDDEKAPKVVLVDQEFAKRNFPGEDPLRHQVISGGSTLQILGVVAHVKAYGLNGSQTRGQFYFPYRQSPSQYMYVTLAASAGDAAAISALRDVVRAIDPDLPVYGIRPMREWLSESTWRDRLGTLLFSLFAGVALILAGTGIYGVMAYAVSERKREMGIRIALGATMSGILGMVLRQAVLLTGVGVVLGTLFSVPAARLLKALLYQVSPSDLGILLVAIVVLAGAGILAAAIPAWRAARTDPMTALRHS